MWHANKSRVYVILEKNKIIKAKTSRLIEKAENIIRWNDFKLHSMAAEKKKSAVYGESYESPNSPNSEFLLSATICSFKAPPFVWETVSDAGGAETSIGF